MFASFALYIDISDIEQGCMSTHSEVYMESTRVLAPELRHPLGDTQRMFTKGETSVPFI